MVGNLSAAMAAVDSAETNVVSIQEPTRAQKIHSTAQTLPSARKESLKAQWRGEIDKIEIEISQREAVARAGV